MWELIQLNKRKSLFLFFIMGITLLVLGYFIGEVWLGRDGWLAGLTIAFVIWIIMSLLSYFSGDSIILALSKAKKVDRSNYPQLYNVVEEMKIASNLPKVPEIYIIPDPAPNAFATGRTPEKSAVVVTAGLLAKLNRDELQGVIAHEISHIMNRDILFMTFSGVLLGSIVFLSHIFLRSLWFSGGNRRRNSGKSGGQLQLILMLVAILMAVLAPIMARLLYLAISRKREYLADASSVRLTRYPEGLASALEKIADNDLRLKSANQATAGLYIANPLNKKGKKLSNLSSTHPPISERVRILRNIAGGVNYLQYQKAYSLITGKHGIEGKIIPDSALKDHQAIRIKKTTSESGKEDYRQKKHTLDDLIRSLNDFSFVTCPCGLKIKIPPNFKGSRLVCPRCERYIEIPVKK